MDDQAGISNGTDVALWQKDPGNQPTGTVMIQWTAPNQEDSIYAGDNAFNNGEFGYNNLQQIAGTWTHKFNDKIYTATEGLYMYMNDATTHPTKSLPCGPSFASIILTTPPLSITARAETSSLRRWTSSFTINDRD